MKKANSTNNQFIFSIYAEDKKGLVGHILIHFNRSSYDIQSMNISRTDISDLVLVTLEAEVPETALNPFKEKLKKVVEIYTIAVYPAGEGLKKTGFYRLTTAALTPPLWALMGKYGAALSSIDEQGLVITKTGYDKDLVELYTLLEGPHLLGFCKSGLIVEESLVPFESL